MARCSQASSEAAVVSAYRSAFSSASWALSFVCSRNVSSEAAAAPPSNRTFAKLPELSLACSKIAESECAASPPPEVHVPSFSGLELGSFQERFVGFRSLVVFAKQHFAKLAVPSAWSVPGTLRRNPHRLQACHPILGACQRMLSIARPASQNGHL